MLNGQIFDRSNKRFCSGGPNVSVSPTMADSEKTAITIGFSSECPGEHISEE